jgi:hypothetical protein
MLGCTADIHTNNNKVQNTCDLVRTARPSTGTSSLCPQMKAPNVLALYTTLCNLTCVQTGTAEDCLQFETYLLSKIHLIPCRRPILP